MNDCRGNINQTNTAIIIGHNKHSINFLQEKGLQNIARIYVPPSEIILVAS